MDAQQELKEKLGQCDALLAGGKLKEAEDGYKSLLAFITENALPKGKRIAVLDGLGRSLFSQSKLAEAEEAFQEIVDLLIELFGEEHSNVALGLQNLARVRSARGAWSEAVELGNRANAILKKNFGPDHPRVAQSLFNISSYKYDAKDYDAAAADIEEAMRIWSAVNGPESMEVSTCLNNLGRIKEEQGKPLAGAKLHQQAVDIRKKILGDHMETAFSLGNLGSALAEGGKLQEAITALKESLACYERIGKLDTIEAKTCRQNLTRCQEAADRESMPA